MTDGAEGYWEFAEIETPRDIKIYYTYDSNKCLESRSAAGSTCAGSVFQCINTSS